MQNREFEKQVQQKMEELKLSPADAVWQKVEAALPEERTKHRRWVVLFIFLLLSTGAFVWVNLGSHKKNVTISAVENENTAAVVIAPDDKAGTVSASSKTNNNSNDDAVNYASNTTSNTTAGKKIATAAGLKITIKKPAATAILLTTDEENEPLKTDKPLITKGQTKVKIKESDTETLNLEINNTNQDEVDNTVTNKPTSDITKLKDSIIAIVKNADSINLVVKAKDSTATLVTTQSKSKKRLKKWQYGLDFSLGSGKITNSIFSNQPVYADARSFNQGITIIPGSNNAAPNSPQAGTAFALGFYAETKLNKKWVFKTGLRYVYQNNSLKVGNRKDSSANFTFDMNKSAAASKYYSTGNSITYKNQFHFIEIPVHFKYKISSSIPVYAETGSSVAYLLSSNALVYNSSASAYITSPVLFNKFLVFVNAGASIDVSVKKKFPLSIGFNLKYSAGSVTQKAFGKQYLTNSLLYLKIPIKK